MPTISYGGQGESFQEHWLFVNLDDMPQDGWITRVECYTDDEMRLAVYLGNQRDFLGPTISVGGGGTSLRGNNIPGGLRVDKGKQVKWGLVGNATGGGQTTIRTIVDRSAPADSARQLMYADGSAPPSSIPSGTNTVFREAMGGKLTYVENLSPLAGVWRSPTPAEGGVISGLNPVVSGTMPHPGAEDGLDSTRQVEISVFNADTGAKVYTDYHTPSSEERDSGVWSKVLLNLQQDTTYFIRFRHQDQFLDWSAMSADRRFSVAGIPDPPTPRSPLGVYNALTTPTYTLTHNHAEGRPANRVQVQLLNGTGSTVLYTSPEIALTPDVAAGDLITVLPAALTGHPALVVATPYRWRARVRDTLNVWGQYSAHSGGVFRVNATPAAPYILAPEEKAVGADRTVIAEFTDPDADPITAAEVELTRVSTNTVVDLDPGNATTDRAQMLIDAAGGTGTYAIPANMFVAGQLYRVRVRATDGKVTGYGPWSSNRTFTYVIAPAPSLVTPGETPRINVVEDPSFEEEWPEGEEFWTVSGATGGSTAERQETEDAMFGSQRLRLHKAAGSPNLVVRSRKMPVVISHNRYLLRAYLKKFVTATAPTVTATLVLDCYNAAGALVGAISPAEVGLANGNDINPWWTVYGGRVEGADVTAPDGAAPNFPAGTTQVEVVVLLTGAAEQDMGLDAVFFEKLPPETQHLAGVDWEPMAGLWGYVDPSVPGDSPGGYDPSGAYQGTVGHWLGEPHRSASEATMIVERPEDNALIYRYFHPNATALVRSRILMDRMRDDGEWEPHHIGEWRTKQPDAAGVILLDFPDNIFQNERRYRVGVEAEDAAAIRGTTGWAEVVVRFTGPPELAILDYIASPLRGEVTLIFESTGLPEEEFGGIEIARECRDTGEKMRIVEIIRNATVTSYTYPFPVSGRVYTYHVRQVRLVGPDRVEGRWRSIDASVDYSGYNFLKSSRLPLSVFVRFRHPSGSGPAFAREKANAGYAPWGASAPVHMFGEGESRSGETVFKLYPDENDPPPEERLETLRAMRRESNALCLLTDKPVPEKTWLAMSGSLVAQRNAQLIDVSFGWTQTAYVEDAYALEGAYETEIA